MWQPSSRGGGVARQIVYLQPSVEGNGDGGKLHAQNLFAVPAHAASSAPLKNNKWRFEQPVKPSPSPEKTRIWIQNFGKKMDPSLQKQTLIPAPIGPLPNFGIK